MEPLFPGLTLNGKWTLGTLIGVDIDTGAQIFEASHRNGIRAAVEVLPDMLARDALRLRRFLRAAAKADWLAGVGTVRPFDDDRTKDGLVYVVYERIGTAALPLAQASAQARACLTRPLSDDMRTQRTAPWSSTAMACLDENQLVAFFSPDRPDSLTMVVEAHTASCQPCRELVAQYASMSAERGTALTQAEAAIAAFEKNTTAAAPSLTPAGGGEPPEARLHGPMLKLIGTTVKGKWQVERLLGVGGMSYVFAARHRNGRRVALKCLRPELATEPSFVERFLHEGYVANKIEHPGAVVVLDDDVMDDGTPFLVMEVLSGRSLRERLGDGTLELGEALDVIGRVLDVLAMAHDRGVVHRDLKPDNLFSTADGQVKVLDFGIARLRERASTAKFATMTGTMIGTVGFMPPEQARGLTAEVDARSDLWSVGATLYTLLSGKAVHEAATTNETLLLAMTTPIRPMAELLPEYPIEVRALLDRALAFDKAGRFPSAQAMKLAVDAARAAACATVIAPAPSWFAVAPSQTEVMRSRLPSAGDVMFPVNDGTSSFVPPLRSRGLKARIAAGALLAGVAMLALVSLGSKLRTENATRQPPVTATAFAIPAAPPLVVEAPVPTPEAPPSASEKPAQPTSTSPTAPHWRPSAATPVTRPASTGAKAPAALAASPEASSPADPLARRR
jgi:serine/threonine protein kinase